MSLEPSGLERREGRGAIRGRGAAENPAGRFERFAFEYEPDAEPEGAGSEPDRPRTEFFSDASRTVVARNDSPDIPFEASLNPYRGCEHGCAYWYARPTHEYLGYSAGLDFETKILVKPEAPRLLREALDAPGWRPTPIALSGVTDAYQPVERRLRITRGCLEVLAAYRNPVSIVTKNALVLRDVDLLTPLAAAGAAAVFVSVTTLDDDLARILEPRTSPPSRRLAAIAGLASAGVPTGVMVAPVIPGLNDHEIPAILEASATAGAAHASYVPLRLPGAVEPLFRAWLERHEPGRAPKVLGRLRSLRGGRLNEARFGSRMRGQGPFARLIDDVFRSSCRRHGLNEAPLELSTASFRRPGEGNRQLRLFD